ncbi:PEP/pyruvate-binding domain-containing protein [Salinibacter altiplanensis]|uniref:PEP/pyruvate-binding domain-containing protein n=1 Tax=Salinibacter altiplanensis TaxID=1803181 RepID=UPI000C9ECB3A|nr:PEP/pyruvate-binding domain-containing protein [Salinibacter altiplanensis]
MNDGPLFLPPQILLVVGLLVGAPVSATAQSPSADVAPASTERIEALVASWKEDRRGPYAGIRWFCPDGSVIPARERCDTPGGLQHAMLKPEAKALQTRHGLYLGQILAGTDTEAFWDAGDRHSRLKQYQLGRYLYAVDDGWILRRAQYYRGAFQAEDEAEWGRSFLRHMLRDEDRVRSHFYLLRQAVRDLPQGGAGNVQQRIRATSEAIADSLSAFMPLRVRIHGQPDSSVLGRVRDFRRAREDTLSDELLSELTQLERALTAVYASDGADRLESHVASLPADHALTDAARSLVSDWPSLAADERVQRGSRLLLRLRRGLPTLNPDYRRTALALSVSLETELLRRAAAWMPTRHRGLLEKGAALARAAAGAGHLELWEWERVSDRLALPAASTVSRSDFDRWVDALRRVAEWGTAMTTAHYQHVVNRYAAFEPAARGFIDDRVRNSVLLPLGRVAGTLGRLQARVAGREHRLLDLDDTGRVRGLTAGVAAGTLHVVSELPPATDLDEDDLYVLEHVPPDLSPVAGLLTSSGGNAVSHVQLLARNLGIPTAAITADQIEALTRYDGTRVFLAVSPEGTVRMVPAGRMTEAERRLVAPASADTLITVETEAMELAETDLRPLRDLRASDGGRIVGPKAANLGQLNALFPDHVSPGLAIPFGVFRAHMDQPMPGTNGSYWDYLTATFEAAPAGRGDPPPRVRHRLDTLRTAIRDMPLRDDFRTALTRTFRDVFGGPMGEVGVFVRSDTNMEDLPTFTGAGLNLTRPNVVDSSDIFDAVRQVWASPYTERSYRWRQRVLKNPEHVYPSVLLSESVNADKSGVLITTGVSEGGPEALTLSFSRGVAGAVKGEATEMTLVRPRENDSDEAHDAALLSPLRTPTITVLPPEGGVETRATSFHRPVLTAANRERLRRLAQTLRDRLPAVPGIASEGPYDVELGFRDGTLWLFQVRPFVEAGPGKARSYYRTLDAQAEPRPTVDLTAPQPR